jgi:hypothetical protein
MQTQTPVESQSSTYSKLLAIKLDEKTKIEQTQSKTGFIGKLIANIKAMFAHH